VISEVNLIVSPVYVDTSDLLTETARSLVDVLSCANAGASLETVATRRTTERAAAMAAGLSRMGLIC
jgi:hypothetical protein